MTGRMLSARAQARCVPVRLLLLAVTLRKVGEAAELDPDAGTLQSLRQALRDKDAEIRATRRTSAADGGRQLSSSSSSPTSSALCESGACQIDLTTGVAGWLGAGATPSDPRWALVHAGSWIGDINGRTAPSMLVATVSFHIEEPGCASFDLAFAADGKIRSAQLNGHALAVPSHGFQFTTAQTGSVGLTAARGKGLFSYGTNSLVLTVANDAGAIGLYVEGTVQLLCPLDEATISMRPSQGPAGGGTLMELRSNTQVSLISPHHFQPSNSLR